MLTRGEEYVAREVEHFETERRDRQIRHLRRQGRRFNPPPPKRSGPKLPRNLILLEAAA